MTNYPYPNMNQPGAQPPWGGQPQQNYPQQGYPQQGQPQQGYSQQPAGLSTPPASRATPSNRRVIYPPSSRATPSPTGRPGTRSPRSHPAEGRAGWCWWCSSVFSWSPWAWAPGG